MINISEAEYQDDLEAVLEYAIQKGKDLETKKGRLKAINKAASYVCRVRGYGEHFMHHKLSKDAAFKINDYLGLIKDNNEDK